MLKAKRKKIIVAIGMSVLNAIIWGAFYFFGIFGGWQLALQDKIYSTENRTGDEIVLVTIDDASIADPDLGRFPDWRRTYYAQVIENLQAAGVAVIGLDVLFSESAEAADDAGLQAALRRVPGSVLAAEKSETGQLLPLPQFRQVAAHGFVNVGSDQVDGVVRRVPLVRDSEHSIFAVEIIKRFLGIPEQSPEITADQFILTRQKLRPAYALNKSYGPIILPVEGDSFLINFFGEPGSFPRLAFADVFHNDFNSALVKDKIVLIGVAGASGIHDEQLTPVSGGVAMPGVEIHANIIQTLLAGESLQNLSPLLGIALIVVLLTLLGLLMHFLSLVGMLLALGAALIAELAAALYTFEIGLLLPFAYLWGGTLLIFLTALAWRYFGEDRELHYLRNAFSCYLSPVLVQRITNNPKALGLGGVKRELTLFFSDIEGFTGISEKLTPAGVVRLLNLYLGKLTQVILKHEGTLDKYIGDAVMAFWNAPLQNSQHALLACQAALCCQQVLQQLNQTSRFKTSLRTRIGIHTGPAIVGNLGLSTRFNYTAVGDVVNLASRLEGVNKIYGTQILISGETYRRVKSVLLARPLDRVIVMGRRKFTEIFELIAVRKDASAAQLKLVQRSQEAFEAYLRRDFKSAVKLYRQIKHPASRVMLGKIAFFHKHPPRHGWRGATVLKSK